MTAVDGIDLGIARGEVFGLLRPSGAGKRTTVEILQGHHDRDADEVSVLNVVPVNGTRAWRSRGGIVRQDESTPAELTVLLLDEPTTGFDPAARRVPPADPTGGRAMTPTVVRTRAEAVAERRSGWFWSPA
ncbi:ATP-binding cassette domain-containing protein [Streptomyces sp. NBC_00663]|uniref:ATP-binding cassette domain-containing protein n=1 Tax=Streptomyces sp. NBC_00663 TaxID=2975801 RepID=UPI002E2FBDBB|nr:ATP-binding cassette domain-containing protein [Streptomyces sp. NBC_00663]